MAACAIPGTHKLEASAVPLLDGSCHERRGRPLEASGHSLDHCAHPYRAYLAMPRHGWPLLGIAAICLGACSAVTSDAQHPLLPALGRTSESLVKLERDGDWAALLQVRAGRAKGVGPAPR